MCVSICCQAESASLARAVRCWARAVLRSRSVRCLRSARRVGAAASRRWAADRRPGAVAGAPAPCRGCRSSLCSRVPDEGGPQQQRPSASGALRRSAGRVPSSWACPISRARRDWPGPRLSAGRRPRAGSPRARSVGRSVRRVRRGRAVTDCRRPAPPPSGAGGGHWSVGAVRVGASWGRAGESGPGLPISSCARSVVIRVLRCVRGEDTDQYQPGAGSGRTHQAARGTGGHGRLGLLGACRNAPDGRE